LRVPWLVVPRGTSAIRQVNGSRTTYTGSGSTRTSSVRFRNFGLHKGIVDVYAWGLTDGRDNVGEIDLRAAGVQAIDTSVCTGVPDASDRCLVFAINTWSPWSNAAGDQWDVVIDVDKDGTADFLLQGDDDGVIFTGEANGLLDALVIDLSDGSLVGGFDATVSANGTTLLMPALASDFGLQKGGPSSFDYWVESYTTSGESLQSDIMNTGDSGTGTHPNAQFDAFKPSLSSGYFKSLAANKVTTVPLTVNTSTYRANRGQKGWLVVTMDDASGANQADMVVVGKLP
jgi:minor extracellular serine protease Vpr